MDNGWDSRRFLLGQAVRSALRSPFASRPLFRSHRPELSERLCQLGTALRHRFAVIFLLCRIIGAESPDVNPLSEILRNRQEAPVFSPPGLVFPTKFSGNFPRLCPGFSGSRQRRRRPQNSASGRHPGRKSPCTGGLPPAQGLPRGGVRKIYRHAAPDAAEWLACRFGTPPGRAVSLWGLSERMAFSLESAGGAAAPLSTADRKSIYPNSEIPMKKM